MTQKKSRSNSVRGSIVFIALLINSIVLKIELMNSAKWYWALFITIPLLLIAFSINKHDAKSF